MHIVACEPFFGGSHRRFLEEWREHSRHDWTLLTLPPRWWKWRMRHAAIDFADRLRELEDVDVVLSSGMVNVAELRGLTSSETPNRPHVTYLHENQLTYPLAPGRPRTDRDLHLAISQIVGALASDEIWFNSEFHRDEFLTAVPELLARMPGPLGVDAPSRLRDRARVHEPGVVARTGAVVDADSGPLRIGWVARWEHDKAPEVFFDALNRLAKRRDYRVLVLGERFRQAPECFEEFRSAHPERIEQWGYVEDRDEYLRTLERLDVVVSTARHEFFGLAVVEALEAGAVPLLPNRLSYPELLAGGDGSATAGLYEGGVTELAQRLERLCDLKRDGGLRRGVARSAVAEYAWSVRAPAMDDALEAISRS